MGEVTKIEWTSTRHADGTVTPGATFNPWIGCTKVSPGCQHCYAEAFAKRYGKAEWGPQAERVRTSAAYWRQPFAWNKKAEAAHTRMSVFCGSLCDIGEKRADLDDMRAEAFDIMPHTPWLNWLLLTKRIETFMEVVPAAWLVHFPDNVWIGTTVENQDVADKRIPALVNIPARVRFLSCEPLLSPIDISTWLTHCGSCGAPLPNRIGDECGFCAEYPGVRGISWVIAGGESGPKARPMHADWVLGLRDQCVAAKVPFLFKQWGEWLPASQLHGLHALETELAFLLGANYRCHTFEDGKMTARLGKHSAGRELDGRTWDEYPAVETTVTA